MSTQPVGTRIDQAHRNQLTPKQDSQPGKNDGTSAAKNPKITPSYSSNIWTTIKFLIATGLSGSGSFAAHFTNIFGDGTIKNFAQIGFDFLTTLGFALTGASALSTYGTDETGSIRTISAN